MSEAREQLAMFGLPSVAVETADLSPASPRCATIDETTAAAPRRTDSSRALRALQRSLPVVVQPAPVEPMPRVVGGVCSARAERLREDGSLGPCPRVRCPHHLAIDLGEPETIGPAREAPLVCSTAGQDAELGRRPGLSAYPETHGEVESFADHVVDRLATLPDTCELDVIARYPDGVPVCEIARVLGVSPEVVRRDTESATRKLFDEDVSDAWTNLEEAAARAKRPARRPTPSKIGEPSTAPRAIVRRETGDVPRPVELTAGEIFTF